MSRDRLTRRCRRLLERPSQPSSAAGLAALLALLVPQLAEHAPAIVVMQAPTGQRFCVVRVQRPGFPKNANRWD
jgi:hypothetical protein